MLSLLFVYLAQIRNPVLAPSEGTLAGVSTNPLAPFIARLWQTAVIAGSLMLIIYLIWGAVDWLMSEGDPEKLKNAKNKIIHSFFGLGLLAASFAIMVFMRLLFGFDLLNLVWPSAFPTSQSGGITGSTQDTYNPPLPGTQDTYNPPIHST